MPLTIAGIPEKIARADYRRLVESLGLDFNDLVELTFHPNSIEARVLARNEKGFPYVEPDIDEVAMHSISIPVED